MCECYSYQEIQDSHRVSDIPKISERTQKIFKEMQNVANFHETQKAYEQRMKDYEAKHIAGQNTRNIPPGFNEQPSPKPKEENPHYTQRKIQPWDAMEDWMTPEQFKGFLLGNAIKYLGRCNFKNSYKEDLKKAQRYIEKLLNAS